MKNTIQALIKRVRIYVVTILGTSGLICTINAQAGFFIEAAPVGPGCSSSEDLFCDNAFIDGFEDSLFYEKTFEEVDYIDLLMIVGNDGQTNSVGVEEFIFNDTGIDWTDYHLELGFVLPNFESDGLEYDFLTIESELRFTGFEDDGTFSNLSVMPEGDNINTIWLDGGIVPDGDFYGLFVEFDLPDFNPATMPAGALISDFVDDDDDDDDETAYVIALRQTPTIAAVPEPSIIALFAAGLFGLGIARRRMRS